MSISSIDFAQFNAEQIKNFIAQAQSALAALQTNQPIRVTVEFSSYNEKRYSRPWIAKITSWPVGGKPTVEWGNFVGSDSGGEGEIMARPGDIVRWGQKDNRGNGTRAYWGVVQSDGTINHCTEVAARNAFSQGGRNE